MNTANPNIVAIRRRLIRWYEQKGRRFPWRETNEPYRVLIAEMLLRRTTATAVARVYPEFIKRYVSPRKLAQANEDEIAQHLSSLGLQAIRAKHLHDTALQITQEYQGTVPDDIAVLQTLPGVGRYTAAAVANFAFSQPAPMVDGNVIHFVRRVFNLKFNGPEDSQAWIFMKKLGGRKQDKRMYWAIIDLVAQICLRKKPRCSTCSLNSYCDYYQTNLKT